MREPTDQLPVWNPSALEEENGVKARTMWQVAPAASRRAEPEEAQSLEARVKGLVVVPALLEVKVWGVLPRLVTVMVRVAAVEVEVSMPKSSSLGEKTRVPEAED